MKKLFILGLISLNFIAYPMEKPQQKLLASLPPLVSDSDEEDETATELHNESSENCFKEIPSEILLTIVEQMIPEKKLIELVKKLIVNFDDLLFKEYSQELNSIIFNLYNLSQTNKQLYNFVNDNIELISDLLIKKLYLTTCPKETVNEKQFPLFQKALYSWFKTFYEKNIRTLNEQPLTKVIDRLMAQLSLIELIKGNNFYQIKQLFEEFNFIPDTIMVYDHREKQNLRLLIYYITNNSEATNSEILEYIINKGANPNSIVFCYQKLCPLSLLISKRGRTKDIREQELLENLISIFLQNNANPNAIANKDAFINNYNHTSLFRAINLYNTHPNLSLRIIKLLLDAGADMITPNKFGKSIFDFALEKNIPAVIKLLLNKKNIDKADQLGRTLLMRFVQKGDQKVVSLLLDHQADINAQDINGFTPLMYAALNGNKFLIDQLLSQKRLQPNLKNNAGETTADVARRYAHNDLAKYIEAIIKKEEGTYYTSLIAE